MDRLDVEILRRLQADATLSLNALAEQVGLGASACWRRVQKLEEQGVIRARMTILDPQRVGLSLVVFATVRTREHSEAWLTAFHAAVANIPEIVEVFRMAGEADYLLRIVVPDIARYDAVYKRLIRLGGLTDVTSSFVMESIKAGPALPLDYIPLAD